MFAGEGDPARTNRRFHLLADGQPATRLSTAFDPVTLYGFDPDERPDIWGKIGTSGVSIATLDDMKDLYQGFDLCDPNTSVSMTINGPAPTILAMFFNAAIDQQLEKRERELARPLSEDEQRKLKEQTLHRVRGTVQADILKEDQGQNTCIFSTEFSLGVMADIQQYFIDHKARNFYSVSISGYHIAEAGANPITQLAFTLANGFTYVESYLARGMAIDDFAPNLSFFFSNGMDPEYSVIGRVARRIWAVAMRDRYGANARAQKLKYHIQTSGRSLHAQEISFNDIRTTLQALCAVYDNANSLHTNAYDEAITTPTDESVRRALAIQMIINKEWGLAMNENPLQGSFIIEELTDLVEEAVLTELERLSERGGVLGAMETGYQRGRIQDDSLDYENRKHDGSLPIIGVNTFVSDTPDDSVKELRLTRRHRGGTSESAPTAHRIQATPRGRSSGIAREAPGRGAIGGNVFAELMETVRHATLGEISAASSKSAARTGGACSDRHEQDPPRQLPVSGSGFRGLSRARHGRARAAAVPEAVLRDRPAGRRRRARRVRPPRVGGHRADGPGRRSRRQPPRSRDGCGRHSGRICRRLSALRRGGLGCAAVSGRVRRRGTSGCGRAGNRRNVRGQPTFRSRSRPSSPRAGSS